MTSKELSKKLISIAKETEAIINDHKKDKTLTKPIASDFIKTTKAMGFEEMLSELKLFYKSNQKDS